MSEPRPKRNPPNKESRMPSPNSATMRSPLNRHPGLHEANIKANFDEILTIDKLIRIDEGDELDPSFIDYFSKYIINSSQMRLDE